MEDPEAVAVRVMHLVDPDLTVEEVGGMEVVQKVPLAEVPDHTTELEKQADPEGRGVLMEEEAVGAEVAVQHRDTILRRISKAELPELEEMVEQKGDEEEMEEWEAELLGIGVAPYNPLRLAEALHLGGQILFLPMKNLREPGPLVLVAQQPETTLSIRPMAVLVEAEEAEVDMAVLEEAEQLGLLLIRLATLTYQASAAEAVEAVDTEQTEEREETALLAVLELEEVEVEDMGMPVATQAKAHLALEEVTGLKDMGEEWITDNLRSEEL